MDDAKLLLLTAEIVTAHVSNNSLGAPQVAELVREVHAALTAIEGGSASNGHAKPSRDLVKRSIYPDHLICFDCGKKHRTLRRHLLAAHALTPSQYLTRHGLPRDYPMTAPNYSKERRELALAIGLGRKSKKRRHSLDGVAQAWPK